MNITLNLAVYIFYFFLFADIIMIWAVIFNKLANKKKTEKSRILENEIKKIFEKNKIEIKHKHIVTHFEKYVEFLQTFSESNRKKNELIDFYIDNKIIDYYHKRLNSFLKIRRIEGAAYLGNIPHNSSREVLEKRLKIEKNYTVKLYIVNALSIINNEKSLPSIVSTLNGSPVWYLEKVYTLIYSFKNKFYDYLPEIIDNTQTEIIELIIGFSKEYIAKELKEFLLKKSDNENLQIRYKAIEALSKFYYLELDNPKFLDSSDKNVLKITIKALSMVYSKDNMAKIIKYLENPEVQEYSIYAISTMLRKEPKFISFIVENFLSRDNKHLRDSYAKILSNRIEYFISKLLIKDNAEIKKVIKEIILTGKISEIIGFLNKNTDIEIENEILSILKEVILVDCPIKNELSIYLNNRIVKKLNIERYVEEKKSKEEKKEKGKVKILSFMLFFLLAIFPILYLIRRNEFLYTKSFIEQLKIYTIDFNYYLVYYSTSVNLIYLLILIFSFLGVKTQSKSWKIKKNSFLFKEKILPSISIIAPAYCEEATIIESTNSLLNLKYPNYELIVVNDGSSDSTLNTLINYYELEKFDMLIDENLNTKPIRGVYINKSMPKFIVVDKSNGGKADSLNAGINVSRKEYFCGIDADSLLEPEALLKAASLMLDTEDESVAVGGNIFPINGCSVDKGYLYDIKLPKNHLAKLQTIEYLRAFMAGRVGWAYINCLLIISGAFGIFKKDRIIEIGGYLTSSGKYKKDTVGEDMELVVRLSKMMREKRIKHSIHYSYNANCWTEVPEDLHILYKQRDRWHRGLIDILTFHKKIIFNPFYGSMGLVSMPYFFIFEIAGPLVEIQGYIMVMVAIFLGLINAKIFLLLFTSTILMGMLISLSSLYIAEKDNNYFTLKESFILLLYAVGENFGVRQIISFWRITGFINSMKKPKGWGKMVRKGFVKKE